MHRLKCYFWGRLVSTQCYHHGRRRQHRSSRYIQTIRPVYTDVTEQNRTELNFLDTFEICKLLSVSPVQFISVLSRQGVNGPLYNCSSSSSDRHDVAESHAAVLFFGCCFVGRQSSATGSTADVIQNAAASGSARRPVMRTRENAFGCRPSVKCADGNRTLD